MSARRVYTEDEVEDLVARAIRKSTKPDKLKQTQDAKILARELAREKRQRVMAATSVDQQIDALGGLGSFSPHQLMKLKPKLEPPAIGPSDTLVNAPTIFDQVLGSSPSSDHMARHRNIQKGLHGQNVGMAPKGEIEIDGYAIPKSNMVPGF